MEDRRACEWWRRRRARDGVRDVRCSAPPRAAPSKAERSVRQGGRRGRAVQGVARDRRGRVRAPQHGRLGAQPASCYRRRRHPRVPHGDRRHRARGRRGPRRRRSATSAARLGVVRGRGAASTPCGQVAPSSNRRRHPRRRRRSAGAPGRCRCSPCGRRACPISRRCSASATDALGNAGCWRRAQRHGGAKAEPRDDAPEDDAPETAHFAAAAAVGGPEAARARRAAAERAAARARARRPASCRVEAGGAGATSALKLDRSCSRPAARRSSRRAQRSSWPKGGAVRPRRPQRHRQVDLAGAELVVRPRRLPAPPEGGARRGRCRTTPDAARHRHRHGTASSSSAACSSGASPSRAAVADDEGGRRRRRRRASWRRRARRKRLAEAEALRATTLAPTRPRRVGTNVGLLGLEPEHARRSALRSLAAGRCSRAGRRALRAVRRPPPRRAVRPPRRVFPPSVAARWLRGCPCRRPRRLSRPRLHARVGRT